MLLVVGLSEICVILCWASSLTLNHTVLLAIFGIRGILFAFIITEYFLKSSRLVVNCYQSRWTWHFSTVGCSALVQKGQVSYILTPIFVHVTGALVSIALVAVSITC